MTDLADRKHDLTRRWQVTVEEWTETPTSSVAFGRRDGQAVVLKIVKTPGDEWNAGDVIAAFAGRAIVRTLERVPGAVLLERAVPGTSLVDMVRDSRDEEATTIVGDVIAAMAADHSPTHSPTISDWGRGFSRYRENGDASLPIALVSEAERLYAELCATQRAPRLLHGDLQHYNVIFDRDRGWLAIDPKGVIGEREFELGPLLRNPHGMPELYTSPAHVARRLTQLCTRLDLDYERALCWAFAQAVLSAIWDVEDHGSADPDGPALMLARTTQAMLG